MKELNTTEDEKILVLNGWGFQILFFKAKKSSEGSQNLLSFPVCGQEFNVIFQWGLNFPAIFLTISWPFVR